MLTKTCSKIEILTITKFHFSILSTSAHSCHVLWQMTAGQIEDHHKFLYAKKKDGTKGNKATTGAKLKFLGSCVFYNNLHSFTRLIAVAGIYPTLSDTTQEAVPALNTFQSALEGNTEATNKCKAILNTMTKSMLNVPREFGTYLRKVHIQDYLEVKTLLLPCLVINFTRFEMNIDKRRGVWPEGYLCKIGANSTAEAPRMLACLKQDPKGKKGRPTVPTGYLALRPDDSHHNRSPICFEFLPFVAFKCNFNLLGEQNVIVGKVKHWLENFGEVPLITIAITAPMKASPSESPPQKRRRARRSPETDQKESPIQDAPVPATKKKRGRKKNNQVLSVEGQVLVEPATEEEKKMINDIITIDIMPEDVVKNLDKEFEWTGGDMAPDEDIYEALVHDFDKRYKCLELIHLRQEIGRKMTGDRFTDLIDTDDFKNTHKGLDLRALSNKFVAICKGDFGQTTVTKESLDTIYVNAVTNYSLENIEKTEHNKKLQRKHEERELDKEREKKEQLQKVLEEKQKKEAAIAQAKRDLERAEIEKDLMVQVQTRFVNNWSEGHQEFLESQETDEVSNNDIQLSILAVSQDAKKRGWLLKCCNDLQVLSDEFIAGLPASPYAIEAKRLYKDGKILKDDTNTDGKPIYSYLTLFLQIITKSY